MKTGSNPTTYINNQTEKLFGYERMELISQMTEQLIPKRFRKHHPDFRNAFFKESSVRAVGTGREWCAAPFISP